MEKHVLKAEPRGEFGKGPNRRLRAQGMVPAILYGGEAQPESLTVPRHELELLLKQTHAMLTLEREGGEQSVMIGEIQRDPLSHEPIHIDFMRIEAGHEVHAHVEVVGVGAAIGVREGGVLERPVREIEIRCLPADLPERVEVNIEELKVNESIKAGDIPLGENIHLVTDPSTVLFHVAIPKAAEAETAEVAAEAQPEIVGKKKEAEAEEK